MYSHIENLFTKEKLAIEFTKNLILVLSVLKLTNDVNYILRFKIPKSRVIVIYDRIIDNIYLINIEYKLLKTVEQFVKTLNSKIENKNKIENIYKGSFKYIISKVQKAKLE